MSEEKLFITFHDKDDILHFVATCCKYDDAIDVRKDKQVTDAKSMLGMLLVQLEQPMEILYDSYDEEKDGYEEFRKMILQEYDVQAVSTANESII